MPPDDHRAAEPFWNQLVTLGPRDEASLQIQIRRNFVRAILDGSLLAETRLPSSRTLARQLGIARNTVSGAYQQLADDGLIEARPRSGYIVNPRHHIASAVGQAIPAAPGAMRPRPVRTAPRWRS